MQNFNYLFSYYLFFQVKAYRDDFEKERRDKERLQRLLRERSAAQV
jgi:hypothetical protein